MAKDIGVMAPHWLDAIIEKALRARGRNKAATVATAICSSKKFMDAVRRGLAEPPDEGEPGPTYAQVIRSEVIQAVESAT